MKRLMIVVAAFFSSTYCLIAQEVGDKVVVIATDSAIQNETKVVDHPPPGEELIVREIKGEWYGVSRGWPGYIHRHDVVPFEQALVHFNNALAANDQDHGALLGRAAHLANMKRFDEANADYTRVIQLAPGNSAAYVGRANCWLEKEAYDNAVADYDEAIRLDPNSEIAFYDRGLAWTFMRQYDKAIADFSSAIRLSPTYSDAYEMRGRAWFQKGELVKAMEDCTDALRHDPKSPSAYHLRGLIRRREQSFESAIADFQEAIRLAPKTGGQYVREASETFAARGQFEEQRDFLEPLLESGPAALRYDVLAALASCHRSRRDFEAALRYIEKAAELKPTDPSTLYALAIMQKNAGRIELALKTYERARDLTESPYMRTSLDVVIAGYRIHAGQRDAGISLFNLIKSDAEKLGMYVNIAWFHAVAKNDEEFYAALRRALESDREATLSWIHTEVDIDSYRNEKRFKELVAEYE